MATIGTALKTMPTGVADQIKLVFVTVDPSRDVPAVLRQWLNHFDSRFIGLTGTESAIEGNRVRSLALGPIRYQRFGDSGDFLGEDVFVCGNQEPRGRAAVLDVRVNHGAQRQLLQVRELRHDVRVCVISRPTTRATGWR